MSDNDRPDEGGLPHDEATPEPGMEAAGDGPDGVDDRGVDPDVRGDEDADHGTDEDGVLEHDDGTDVAGAGAAAGSGKQARRRVPWSPWWRLAAASLAIGALTWGATTSDATFRLDTDGRRDRAGAPATTDTSTFVQSALLACPGPVPWAGDDEEAMPRVDILASGVPQSVLDGVPPRAADDEADATAAPDDAAGTSSPDEAAATASPSGDAAPRQGGSVVRATADDGPSAELQRGRPDGFTFDEPGSAVAEADGDLAPGAAGGQLGLATVPGARGLTLTGCTQPSETQWLVGGGDAPGRSEQLVLTNPGPDAVTVDVSVWGAEGPVDTTGASGIVVPGGGRVVELLDAVAPAVEASVVAVTATGGPVVAHLAESYREGTTDRGTEVVSPAAEPSTDLVLPALPALPEGHQGQVVLRVGAPGEAQAVVDLTALTADGAVRLADQVTRVQPGRTVDVELGDLPEGTTALRLRSDEPVTAGARLEVLPAEEDPEIVDPQPGAGEAGSEEQADGEGAEQAEPLLRAAGEVAWVAATEPSTTPTGMALPDRGEVPRGTTTLALAAVDGTTAWVTWVDETGEETSRSVRLANDSTAALELPAEARAVWVVGAGPAGVVSSVHVSGADDRGPFLASSTVPAVPWLRQVTEVLPVVP